MEIIDTFKKFNAPFIIESFSGYERKRYTSEAYTEEYMLRSDYTNHLCRYVILDKDNKIISVYQHFGIKPTSDKKRNIIKLLERMTREERKKFYLKLTDLRFKDYEETCAFINKYNSSLYYSTDLELYTIATSRFLQEIIWDLVE